MISRCLILALALAPLASAEPAPSAQEILASVRMRQAQQQIDLQGQLRENEIVVPFKLIQSGPIVRYIFSNPDEALQLQLGEKESRLDEITRAGIEKISPAQFDHQENVRTRNCWKLQLRPPSRDSQYANVLLWIDKGSGALMRMEGYDAMGQMVKRFEVISAQKIDNRWFLKQMRIEEMQPGTNHVQSRTYLEIKK